jgi:transcription antitermination factor NusG
VPDLSHQTARAVPASQKRGRTKGGEALAEQDRPGAQWFVLWTHSHCEQLVNDQLAGRGFEVFLPTIKVWSRSKSARRPVTLPMFPGYAFVHSTMDKWTYVEVMKTRGLVRILGERWDRLAPVADGEIDSIQRVAKADVPVLPFPFLRQGERVRITDGALAGLEGILVHVKASKGMLVISVDLLQRSVAVEVDCTRVAPIASGALPARGHVARATVVSFVRHRRTRTPAEA